MAVNRSLPSGQTAEGTAVTPTRTGPYGEAYVLNLGNGMQGFGDEGTFYYACNPTLGTGIAGHAAPVVADADDKPLLHLFNGGTKNIIPVFLHLHFTAIGAGGTISYNAAYTDQSGATAFSSGGDAITPVCTKSNVAGAGGATIRFGAVVSALVSPRKVFQQVCREVIPVVQDTMTVYFGSPNGGMNNALTAAGTATHNLVQYAPPVVVAPGGNFCFTRIRASQSGADSYSFSFGYVER
jgi:hypothetical protein